MEDWTLVYDGFVPEQQALREALCTLGNGYFATRGAAEEARADDLHYPGTYFAGGYDRLLTEIAGRTVENEDLVNWPNWLCLSYRLEGGDWLDLRRVEILAYQQTLDVRAGMLGRQVRFRDAEGRETTLHSRRLVHMGNPHLAAIESTLTAENWSGRVEVRTALDGHVRNAGVARYRELRGDHLEPIETRRLGEDGILLRVQTRQSEVQLTEAARTRAFLDEEPVAADRDTRAEPGHIEQILAFPVLQARPVRVEKVVTLFTSRDRAVSHCGVAAGRLLGETPGFAALARTHAAAWARLWRRCDLELDCEGRAQLVLRLHVFHLLQTVSTHSIHFDAGVPARGLHGEAYRGHIFWDELFIFPFLNLRIAEITRALLLYRYTRLPEARRAAREAGYRGAMYPWQSGSDGREETQVLHLNPRSGHWIPDHSRLQRHINAAIAYNVWQYYQVRGDVEFMVYYGAEMLLEIARFWASLATYATAGDRYEIRGVMGPDEYHDAYPGAETPGIDNNAYTNVMVSWVLQRALDALGMLEESRRRELCERLEITDEETSRWDEVSRRMRVPFHGDGIISQFEGYERLAEFDWEGYRARYGTIQRLDRILDAEGDSTNRYQVSKQADVLMLFYLFSAEELARLFERLGYRFMPDSIRKNVDYYHARTSHGSTLSQVVHAWLLARSDRRRSWEAFCTALASDVADIQGGTTPEGIHLGAMAGTVDIVQRCYTGVEARGDVLWLDPRIPEAVRRLRLRIRHRGTWLGIEVADGRLRVEVEDGRERTVGIGFRGQVHACRGGETREFVL